MFNPRVSEAGPSPVFDIGEPALTDVWVDPSRGDDAASGANRAQALRSINAAWQRVPAAPGTRGFRIQLIAGDYFENDFPAYWESKHGSRAAPIILQSADGAGAAHLHGFLNLYDVQYLYLIGLDMQNRGDVLHCERCDHFLIRQSRLLAGGTRLAHETLKINQSSFIYIEDSDIGEAYENAIDFVAVQSGHIVRNRIHDADDWCMYLKGGSAYFRIESNRIYNCGTGGFTAGQGTGFEYMVTPWLHYEAYSLRVVNNLIHHTEGAGLGVNGGYDILLAYNTLYRVGQRSHVLEFVFGSRSCDGDTALPQGCADRLALGGWGTTNIGGDGEPIPNRNIQIYNNLVYNPDGAQSQWQHFAIYGPRLPTPGSNIPSPAHADDNLRIRGNLIWNGPADHPLGLGEDSGCQTQNPTCNPAQLTVDNRINTALPLLMDPENGDFRPAPAGTLFDAAPLAIPAFPDWDRFTPAVPSILPDVVVDTDFDGAARTAGSAIGAYAGANPATARADLAITAMQVSPAAPTEESAFSAEIQVKNQGAASAQAATLTIWTHQPGPQGCGSPGNATVAVGDLAAGQTRNLAVPGLAAGAAGAKTLRAFIDSGCTVEETDETNNQFAQTYSVTAPPGPDFIISAISLTPASPKANKPFQAKMTVTNRGNAAGNGGNLALWTDQPNTVPCGAKGGASRAVGNLAAGRSKTFTLGGLRAGATGTKTLRAFIDNACRTAEASEGNNQLTQTYRVR